MIKLTIVQLILCMFLLKTVSSVYKPCQLQQYPTGYVCVCNETYCDTTDVPKPTKFGEYVTVKSTEGGQRFNATRGFFVPHKSSPEVFRVERSIDENGTTKAVNTISLTIDREKPSPVVFRSHLI